MHQHPWRQQTSPDLPIDRSVLDDRSIRTRRSTLPSGEGLGGEAGVSRTMVRAGRTASACMPMRALQVRAERVMKLGTLDNTFSVLFFSGREDPARRSRRLPARAAS